VKNVRTTCFSSVFCKFFSLWPEQFLLSVGDREAMQTKVTAGKTLKRAGATPLRTAFSHPKICGVAPALSLRNGDRVLPACRSRRIQGVVQEVTQTR
jgi:hypothetical protein